MTDNERVNFRALLMQDLQNEVKHMMFYLRAASEVEGLHREELREFFMKEAHEEMGHVHEFADMLTFLGGVPSLKYDGPGFTLTSDPYKLLEEVVRMEEEVARNYAKRLQQTEPPDHDPNCQDLRCTHNTVYDPEIAALHVFYEDQIKNSQMTAWEVKKWLRKFPITATLS